MSVPMRNDISIWRPGGKVWRIEIVITAETKAEVMEHISKMKVKINEEIPDAP